MADDHYNEAQAFKDEVIREEMTLLGLHGRCFRSWSKGRSRPRKKSFSVLLFSYGTRWYMIKEDGDSASERIPWDKIADEVRWSRSESDGNGTVSGDGLRSMIIDVLWRIEKF